MNRVPTEPVDESNVEDCFRYKPWDEKQQAQGKEVVDALIAAVLVALKNVPSCPDRTVGIRKLREARMDFNSAITHRGKF